jgi:hypothetical protein
MGTFAYLTANVIDMLMVQDGEEPSPQIGAVLPQMLFGDGAGEAALHEIVSASETPGQRARIAAQPRDLRLEHPREVKFPLEKIRLVLAVEADLKPYVASCIWILRRSSQDRITFMVSPPARPAMLGRAPDRC